MNSHVQTKLPGISIGASSPFRVSNHLSGTSTLYNGSCAIPARAVNIPAGSASASDAFGRPTGQVQNNLSTAPPLRFVPPAPNGKGIPAPFVYAGAAGTSVQVHYEIAGSSAASVVLTAGGQTAPPFNFAVAQTAVILYLDR